MSVEVRTGALKARCREKKEVIHMGFEIVKVIRERGDRMFGIHYRTLFTPPF